MVKDFEVTVTGLNEVEAMFLKLHDFQKLLRVPLSAAGGVVKDEMVRSVGSKKAQKAIKVAVKSTDTGLVAKIGPKGGATRPGFIAALFLERGTGIHGPRKVPVRTRSGKAMAMPSQAIVDQRFGPQKTIFTNSGRIRAAAIRKFGNAAYLVFQSDTGMMPKPWFDRAVHASEGGATAVFAEKLHEAIYGGN